MELMQASREWSSRPADERFVSLYTMQERAQQLRDNSQGIVITNRHFQAMPAPGNERSGLILAHKRDEWRAAPTHHAFGQLAALAGAPAGYLRKLDPALAADCLNYGMMRRDVEEIGLLMTLDRDAAQPHIQSRAATGPNYGRVWNSEIVDTLVHKFGDGLSGDWRVPGEFGKKIDVTTANTTLYLGDTTMFVFLADEVNRIEIADRRDGKSGSLARGFFVSNSEVGDGTLYMSFFLFDYACCNRIVWGAQDVKEIRIRHTSGAPDRWLEELQPALITYANRAASPVEAMLAAAQQKKIDDVENFLATRFSARTATAIQNAHQVEEQRPIESVWDAITGITAYAKSIPNQDDRVKVEREAGKLFALAA